MYFESPIAKLSIAIAQYIFFIEQKNTDRNICKTIKQINRKEQRKKAYTHKAYNSKSAKRKLIR
jgi:hypothetical protein